MNLPPADSRELADDLSGMFGETVHVDELQQRELAGAKLSVVEMGYTQVNRNNDGPNTTTRVRQTAVVLADPLLDLPQFQLRPTIKGILGMIMSVFGDMGDINFPDSPKFSEDYHLHAWNEEPVRLLFNRSIRDFFDKNAGWSVYGNKHHLVIFRHDQVCPAEELDGFVNDTLQVMALFQESEEKLDERPDIRRETRPQDISATANRMGGVVGSLMQSQLKRISVTQDELEFFLQQPMPRSIPGGMRRQVVGENFPLIIVGAMFFAGGIVAGTSILTLGDGAEGWLAIPFGLVFPLIGGLIMFFTIRHRMRKKRVLRNGIVAEGCVTDVKRTSVEVNDQRRYHVSFHYSLEGVNKSAKANVYGMAVEQARSFLASGDSVRVLVDPNDPNHVVCVDLLMIFD